MRIFIVWVFTLGLFWTGYTQPISLGSIEVTYVKAFKSLKDTSDATPKKYRNIEYLLTANSKESRFEYLEAMDMDDIERGNRRFVNYGGGGDGVYYKNLQEKKLLRETTSSGKDFLIHAPYDRFEWELLRETKEILGYTCYKAKGEYADYNPLTKKDVIVKVTVWYTPEIPLPFGPDYANGVPGLVLETIRGPFYITAEEVKSFDKVKKIKKPSKGKEITEKEYLEWRIGNILGKSKK